MTRNDFLQEILEACSFFHFEMDGIWKHYEITSITNNIVKISVASLGFDNGYCEDLEFQNDETLIDKMIDKL